MRVHIAALTAIQMVLIVFSGSFSNEILHLMKASVSVMACPFVRAKVQEKYIWNQIFMKH